MTPSEYRDTLADASPPAGLEAGLLALWWDAKGDWSRAHEAAAADEDGGNAAWVHASLHRKEGDAGNARSWYARAGRPVPREPLEDEWRAIAEALLGDR